MRVRNITKWGGGGSKLLLLVLLVSLTAAVGLTLSAAAQTRDGGADDADPQGRIIARIQDRTGDDGVDDYRIEFGFFPEWAMDDKDPWTEAITTWSDWLPRARYLTKTVIERRDADDNRRWLRSSLISVPANASAQQDGRSDADFEDDGGEQQNLIEGRVVARYSPDSRGRLRVEFGFLPECAFTSTSNTEEAVEQYGEDLLPRARYLSASMIESRRGTWLRSSVVDVPSTCDGDGEITLTRPQHSFGPSQEVESVRIGAVVGELTAELDPITITGVPDGLTLNLVPAGSDDDGRPRQNLMLSGTVDADIGTYTVRITARFARGEPVPETFVIVIDEGPEQDLSWDNYSPAREEVDDEVTLPAPRVIRGPDNPEWSYASDTVDICTVRDNVLTPHEEGTCRVTATSAAREGFREGNVEGRITVEDVPKPVPEITWRPGYNPTSFAVFGDGAPRLTKPTATVDGRSVQLDYTYEVDEISTDVCEVTSRSGTLMAKKAGTCLVIARSVETDDYAAAESRPVRVTITKVSPGLRWNGYDDANLRPGGDPVAPREPQPRVSEARGELTYTYSATPRSVCSVNRDTGRLTPLGEGRCDVTVSSAETDNFLGDEVSVTVEITVSRPEIIDISCSPSRPEVDQNVTCDVRLAPNGGEPDTYSWSGGDSRSSSETYRTSFSSSGTKTVRLTVSNSAGSDSDSTSVEVPPEPPEVSISCSPSSVETNERTDCTWSLIDGDRPTSWSWSDSDGGSGSNSSYSARFTSAGTKTVYLTASNDGGSDRRRQASVTVSAPPRIDSISCSPSQPDVDENVTCTASLSGGTPDSYSWSDDGGGSSSGPRETYRTSFSSSGTKAVRLTVRNTAGSDSESTSVEVQPEPPEVSISCSPSSVDTNESTDCTWSLIDGDRPTSWSWSDSDGGSGSNSSYRASFTSAGTKTVYLTASNAGGDDRRRQTSVTVTEPVEEPQVSISCSPSSVDTNESTDCTWSLIDGDRPTSWSWSDSDGGSGSNSSYRASFTSAGTKTVYLTASNAGGDDRERQTSVTVTEPVEEPQVSVNCPSSAETNDRIECTYSRTSGDRATSWSWSDSDGGSGSNSSYRVSFTSAGTKTVYLTASNAGGSGRRSQDTVTVSNPVEPPQVSVNCPSSAETNDRIECTYSRTSGDRATSWSWSDSDGGSGSNSSYRVSFTSAGTKTVYLTASNAGGSGRRSQDSVTVSNPVEPPQVRVNCPSSAEENDRIECTYSRTSGDRATSWSWSDSDGGSGSGSSYRVRFTSRGTKTVYLTASNAGGSGRRSQDSVTVTVPPPDISISCTAYVIQGNSARCSVDNDGGSITSYSWSGGSSSGSSSSYRPSFSSFGRQTVRLTASNAGGSDSDSIPVDVLAPPPSTGYGRCGNDGIRVYYFESASYTKRWLNMTWEEVVARVPGWGEHLIGHLSQSACNSWPNGTTVTASNW